MQMALQDRLLDLQPAAVGGKEAVRQLSAVQADLAAERGRVEALQAELAALATQLEAARQSAELVLQVCRASLGCSGLSCSPRATHAT